MWIIYPIHCGDHDIQSNGYSLSHLIVSRPGFYDILTSLHSSNNILIFNHTPSPN